jgi:hypothetical protein
MGEELNKPRTAIYRRAAMVAAWVVSAVLGATGSAQADGWKKKHHRYHAPGYVFVPPGHVRYYAPAPVIYAAPPPIVVYPQPMAYAPVYRDYAPSPPSLNLGLTVPLY